MHPATISTELTILRTNRAYRDCKKEWVRVWEKDAYWNPFDEIDRPRAGRRPRRLPVKAGSAEIEAIPV
jgi:hypothetical protein